MPRSSPPLLLFGPLVSRRSLRSAQMGDLQMADQFIDEVTIRGGMKQKNSMGPWSQQAIGAVLPRPRKKASSSCANREHSEGQSRACARHAFPRVAFRRSVPRRSAPRRSAPVKSIPPR